MFLDLLQMPHLPLCRPQKKAVYLKAVGAALRKDHGSDIPDSVQQLCKLPGVGPKMAHLTMSIAWGNLSGIGPYIGGRR